MISHDGKKLIVAHLAPDIETHSYSNGDVWPEICHRSHVFIALPEGQGLSSRRRNMMHQARSIGLAAALACSLATSAAAEVRIDGAAAAVRVTTNHDSIADVLTALAPDFRLRYRAAVPLGCRRQRGLCGLARPGDRALLDGYDFVVKRDGDGIEVVVLGRRGDIAIPPAPPAASKSVVSRWR